MMNRPRAAIIPHSSCRAQGGRVRKREWSMFSTECATTSTAGKSPPTGVTWLLPTPRAVGPISTILSLKKSSETVPAMRTSLKETRLIVSAGGPRKVTAIMLSASSGMRRRPAESSTPGTNVTSAGERSR